MGNSEARKAGATGTPAFMIGRTEPNGTKVKVLAVLKGAKSFADFKAEFDRLLEEAAKPQAEAAPHVSPDAPTDVPVPAGAVASPTAPRVSSSPDGKLDETTRATLARVLSSAPSGSPAWMAAPQSDPRALALAQDVTGVFTKAGWRVRPLRRSAVRVKPGTYLFAADEAPPAYVATARQALEEAGFARTVANGYRQYYEEMKRWESLEVVLIAAAFEQHVSLAFLDDGVSQLKKGHQTKSIEVKGFEKTYGALEDYDVEKLYVDKESLDARGLTADDLTVPVEVLSRAEIGKLMDEQDVILSF